MKKIFKGLSLLSLIILIPGLDGNPVLAANHQFTKNLYFGLKNDQDVVKLQDLLRKLGFFKLPLSGGNYFGLTKEAVRGFQIANSIKPANGSFGPLTRQVANNFLNSTDTNTSIKSAPVIVPTINQIKNSSATSTYFGKLRINDKNIDSKIENESLAIENTSTTSESLNITGFKLVNSAGDEFIIPKGHNLPGVSPTPEDQIILKPDDVAKIMTGRQERQMDFRENLCTGYFNESSNFYNKIQENCPRPEVRGNLKLPDHCIKIFESGKACRTVDSSKIQVSECLAFSEGHLNYQGCINDYKNKSDFYSRRWLIWMQKSKRFLRDIHDEITLLDKEGKIVHKINY